MSKAPNDSQFLNTIAHQLEIGDPVEQRDIDRLRDIANSLPEETIDAP